MIFFLLRPKRFRSFQELGKSVFWDEIEGIKPQRHINKIESAIDV